MPELEPPRPQPSLTDDAVGLQSERRRSSWSSTDAIVYALGVGAGADELRFTTENSAGHEQRALPTMAVVVGQRASVYGMLPRMDWTKVIHAEQTIELFATLPAQGELSNVARVAEVWDKGTAAMLVTECDADDPENGRLMMRTRWAAFIRGAGGWGGRRGPASDWARPERAPDVVVSARTRPDQALAYRLSGDRNRLHSDPAFAARAGFDRPILHGLCTYGFAGRALLETVCHGDPDRFGRMHGRFSAPVFPGDELRTAIWTTADGEAVFETSTQDGSVALTHGEFSVRGRSTGPAATHHRRSVS
ncbi:MAG: 3-alpha,7-alpha, 12-alpha-trihydroxy-5-beta-cholest-24-enoyl-CoAhydratase [Conexibacter sp.]|nr:3-alpha,7-alpha, 12-alpha-trihydroxy-5-beta-cholest-24-enoyl-CoAhydratase [Conexibacter sp.]